MIRFFSTLQFLSSGNFDGFPTMVEGCVREERLREMRASVAGANLVCCLVCKVYVGAGRASEAKKGFSRLRTSINVVRRQGPNMGTSMTLKSALLDIA